MYIGVYKLKTNCREKWTVFYLDLFRDRTHTYTESQNNKINLSIKKNKYKYGVQKKGSYMVYKIKDQFNNNNNNNIQFQLFFFFSNSFIILNKIKQETT